MTVKAKVGLVFGSLLLLVCCLYVSASLQLRHESSVRMQAEQQLLMSLSLMAEPFLAQNKVDQIKGHLLASSFATTLPVKAILVYQADGNLFAATQFPRELFNFSPHRDLTGKKPLQDGSNLLWSPVMVTPASLSYLDTSQVAVEGSILGYVAIQISPLRLSPVWVWQSVLWSVVLLFLLFCALWTQQRAFNKELLQWRHFLRQLKTLVADSPAIHDEAKHQELQPAQLFRLLSAQKQQLEQQKLRISDAEIQKEQSRCIAIEQLAADYKQQCEVLQADLKYKERRLHQWQQLCVLAEHGRLSEQSELLRSLLKHDQLDSMPLCAQQLYFPDWLCEQATIWQVGFESQQLDFTLVEDPALTLCNVSFYAEHTAELLRQIIAVLLQDVQQNELILHINMQAFAEHKLLFQFDHGGQSVAIKQVLAETSAQEPAVLQQLCATLLDRLHGKLSVSALEGVGCSIRLELPLLSVSAAEQFMFQTAIFLDANTTRGAMLKQSVACLAEQVIYLQHPNQLKFELQHRLVDVILLQLPEPEVAAEWAVELQELPTRSKLIAFCNAKHQAVWRDTLSFPILVNPMYSAVIRKQLKHIQKESCARLLVVDDNQTNLAFVKAMLDNQELDVDTASTGARAIQMAKSSRYDIILMDIQLPDISGIMATQMIRQLPQHQHTVILAFTAHALPDEISQFHQAGMNDVVLKPLDAHKVANLVRQCRQFNSQTPIQD